MGQVLSRIATGLFLFIFLGAPSLVNAGKSAESYYQLGLQFQEKNQLSQAITAFQKALKLDPNHEPTLLTLSLLFLRINALNEAEITAKRVLSQNPNHAVALNNLALVYLQRQNIDIAISIFQKAVTADENNPQIRKNLAFILTKVGQHSEAINHYETLLAKFPNDFEIMNLLAMNYYKLKNPSQAEKWLKASLKINNKNPETYYSLGIIYLEQGLNKEAGETFGKSLELNPKKPSYLLGSARAFFALKKYKEAKNICEKIVALEPNNPDANKLLLDIAEKSQTSQYQRLIFFGGTALLALLGALGASYLNSRKKAPVDAITYEEWERNLRSCEESSELASFVLSSFSEFLSLPEGVIYLLNPQRDGLEVASLKSTSKGFSPLEIQWEQLKDWLKTGQYLPQTLLQARKNSFFSRAFPNAVHMFETVNLRLFIPLVTQQNFYGIVALGGVPKQKFTKLLTIIKQRKINTLNDMARRVSTAIEISNLYRLSILDENTGIYNKRYFQTCLTEEIKYASLHNQCCSLLMFDLDHFKQLNDTYGHQQGDIVLRELASQLKLYVRDGIDIVARYGGEEFVIILPGIDLDKALETGELIREKVSQYNFLQPSKSLNLTVSVGIATYPDHSTSEWELLKKADMAMYWSKRGGRNKVTTASKDMKDMVYKEPIAETRPHKSLGGPLPIKETSLDRVLPTFQNFQERMKNEVEKANKEQYELCICIVEIKNYHNLGKSLHIIPQLTGILQPLLRIYDLYGLFTERAIMVLLPERQISETIKLMEKFVSLTKEYTYYALKGIPALRIGIASYPHDGKTAEEILEQLLMKERVELQLDKVAESNSDI